MKIEHIQSASLSSTSALGNAGGFAKIADAKQQLRGMTLEGELQAAVDNLRSLRESLSGGAAASGPAANRSTSPQAEAEAEAEPEMAEQGPVPPHLRNLTRGLSGLGVLLDAMNRADQGF